MTDNTVEHFYDDGVFEVPSATPNFRTELAEQLATLVPEAVADGKIDVTKLQELLADDVADDSERFGLFWPGKKRALRAAQEPTTATLRPDFENSKDWDTTQNVFIEGDNLEVLKILQKHYHGKIKLIYIDPPYNTGKDFVYPDNYKEGLDSYLEWTRQVNEEGKKLSTNSETEGRYHSNWLNMMYPRLKLARNLLTEDGVIFISIDDNEQVHLRKMLDEVFGESNFVATFKWNKTSKAPSLSKLVRSKYEYVLAYRKRDRSRLRGADSYNTEAPLFNSANKVRTIEFPPGTIAVHFQDGVYPAGSFGDGIKSVTLENPLQVVDGTNADALRVTARFAWTQETLNSRLEEGVKFAFKTPKFTTMYYTLENEIDGEAKFIAPSDLISPEECGVKRNTDASEDLKRLFGGLQVFDYPKPVSLLKYLLRMIPEDNFIALDFFAGSGALAEAVMELNCEDSGVRKCIQVQLPEPAPENSPAIGIGLESISAIARARIKLAGERLDSRTASSGEAAMKTRDFGFRSFLLADSNFSKWRSSSETDGSKLSEHLLDLKESANDDATQDDLLFEILLKQGYSLTEKIEPVEIGGLELRSVADGVLLAYLNEHTKPTLEQLRAVVAEAPARLVVLEDAFHGDDELKTNLAQLCKSHGVELWTA